MGSAAECGKWGSMRGLLLTSIAVMMLGTGDRSDAEACRFAGTTDPSGKVAVTADVTETNGTTHVDVTATFETTTMFWFRIHYLVEEVSTWRSGELETVGVNTRYLLGSHIVRQTWDLFKRDRDGMHARLPGSGGFPAQANRHHPPLIRNKQHSVIADLQAGIEALWRCCPTGGCYGYHLPPHLAGRRRGGLF
jgi:hypothetical protein